MAQPFFSWHTWVIIGFILGVVEIFSGGFVLACFAVGSFCAAVSAALELRFSLQIFTFSISSLVAFVGVRPFLMRHKIASTKVKTNYEALPGSIGFVSERIDSTTGKGRVKIFGDDWIAVSEDLEVIETGAKVVVDRLDGNRLVVRTV